MKIVTLIGASGSIGKQTIEILKNNKDKYKLVNVAVGNNVDALKSIIEEFDTIENAFVENSPTASILSIKYKHINFFSGYNGLREISSIKTDIFINAVVSHHGIEPTFAAINSTKHIAIANKETIVMAGHLLIKKAIENDVKILPIDSEHSAILQALDDVNRPKKVTITASGGPFFGKTHEELENATLDEAKAHPNWSMGTKISIDSATMANKGFELIEAMYLFDLAKEQLDAIIERSSNVHALINYEDNSTIAKISKPSMLLPIQYALTYPNKYKINSTEEIDISSLNSIDFHEISKDTFPMYYLIHDLIGKHHSYYTVLNAANDSAISLFIDRKISFNDIYKIVKKEIDSFKEINLGSVSEIYDLYNNISRKIKKEYI